MVRSVVRLITGAPGAGKSTLLGRLRERPVTVVDFDELPDDDGRLLGIDITSPDASGIWPDYNRLWVRIAGMLARGGGPVLVSCPITPAEWEAAAADVPDAPEVVWARLDCADHDRRVRLAARGWSAEQVEEAVQDADELRELVPMAFTSSDRAPAEVAEDVLRWITDSPNA
ncbi:AAA family ATPase [Kitasatospora sp. NPDC087271]|uniref:AAA family ATPase n=1 Tax=Kitasatospora sp. NPDC087271 TaxID=3364067 RepID=UPI0037FFBDB4